MSRYAVFVLLLQHAVHLLAAEHWPGFRGPDGDGQAGPGQVPIQWSRSENVMWKVPLAGEGWSSPTIVDGRIYLTTSVAVGEGRASDLSLRLVTLGIERGQMIRDIEIFRQDGATAPRIHEKNSHASPTPVSDLERVYVHFGHQGTAAVDLGGKIVWRNRTLRYQPVHGNGGSPIVVDDTLIFSCDGADEPFVVGLDTRSGEPRWRKDRHGLATRPFSFSTPTVVRVAGRNQVITAGSNLVQALDPRNGEQIWFVRYDGYSVIPKPLAGHGLVFVCTGYDRPSLLAIRPDAVGDITETHVVWSTDRAVPHTASPLLAGEELYMVSDRGIATCLDARTGRLHWRQRIGGTFSASPIMAGNRIYLLSEQGEATIIRPGRTFRKVAVNSIGERTLASPAVSARRLYLRGAEHLFCIAEPAIAP